MCWGGCSALQLRAICSPHPLRRRPPHADAKKARALGIDTTNCCRGAEINAKTVDELFEDLDTNGDGVVSAEEFRAMDANNDGRVDLRDMIEHEADYISIKKLQKELAFRDEKRTACKAGVMFVIFNIIGYQIVVDSHVR